MDKVRNQNSRNGFPKYSSIFVADFYYCANFSTMSNRSFSHPLFGSDIATLSKLLYRNYPIPLRQLPQASVAFTSALLRMPVSWMEKIITARSIKNMPPMKAPVFIIGHWRSGTTHLCNVLSKSPDFGYVSPIASGLPWELLTIGRFFRNSLEKQLPSDRLIDQVPVTPESPQEDEFGIANMFPISFLHGLYFPKNFQRNFNQGIFFDDCSPKEIETWQKTFIYYLKKVSLAQDNRQLLIRNPAYTTRVQMLRELWPGAKFIHIYRNPYRVFTSMKNYYQKLFPALAWQKYDHVDIDTFILETYKRMMTMLIEQSKGLPPNEFMEVRFEDFEANPSQMIQNIYQQLELEGLEKAEPYFDAYLNSIKNYKKNKYQENPQQKLIQSHWQSFIEHWNY